MKNTVKFLLAAAVATLCLAGCHKDLDIIYDNALSSSNMWKDPSDLEQSVPGIYQRMRNFFSGSECNVFYFGELRVGDYMWGPSLESKVNDNFKIAVRHSTLNGANTNGWSGLYSTIDQANAVLAHAGQCNAKQERVDWAMAQAYFARAFSYFYAARIWGDVPLNLNPVESTDQPECYPVRAKVTAVLAQVQKDIEDCEALGNALGNEKYFGTPAALNMLKAEYALWMYTQYGNDKSYLTMAEAALAALNLSQSSILANYSKIFDRMNKTNSEIVFALNNTASTTAGYQIYFCQPSNLIAAEYRNNPVPISSTQWLSYPQSFVDKLKAQEAAGDTRIATNLGYGPYSASPDKHEITWCNKLLGDMSKSPVILDNDLLYYRYGYAVMLLAEMKYYQGKYAEALDAINIIAKRAYGADNHYTDASKDAVFKTLVDEYFYEFPAEGVIYWALIRTGKIWDMAPNSEIPSQTFKVLKEKNPNILLWPIANGSITKNPKLSQTEGWS